MSDFQERVERAYELDSQVYHGHEVSEEDMAFVASVINEIFETDDPPIGYSLWASFAAKDYNVD